MSTQNLVNFKRNNALYRREIRTCKKESIQILTFSIGPDINVNLSEFKYVAYIRQLLFIVSKTTVQSTPLQIKGI